MASRRKRRARETQKYQPRKQIYTSGSGGGRSNVSQNKVFGNKVQKQNHRIKSKVRDLRKGIAKDQDREHLKPSMPFGKGDHVLLVGEGDFSFALSMVRYHGRRFTSLTATTNESREATLEKYPQAEAAIDEITCGHVKDSTTASDGASLLERQEQFEDEDEGQAPGEGGEDGGESHDTRGKKKKRVQVLYRVDATKLQTYPSLRKHKPAFTKIIFNFPHVGGKSTDVNRQVRSNQALVHGYFESCLKLLACSAGPTKRPSGAGAADVFASGSGAAATSIVVTLFEGEPYTLWNIRDLARSVGLVVRRSWRFDAAAFPGYKHARTLGNLRDHMGDAAARDPNEERDDIDEDDDEDGDEDDEKSVQRDGDGHGHEKKKKKKRKGRWRGEERSARTYEFGLPESVARGGHEQSATVRKKRKEQTDGDSSDGS